MNLVEKILKDLVAALCLVFSPSFHREFVTTVLLTSFKGKKEVNQSPFASHVPLEFTLLLVVAMVAGIVGVLSGLVKGSWLGWMFGVIGWGTILYFFVRCLKESFAEPISLKSFNLIVFFFFVCAGASAGLAGGLYDRRWVWLMVAGGLMAGYFLGLFFGLFVGRMGWMGETIGMLLGVATLTIVCMDVFLWLIIFE